MRPVVVESETRGGKEPHSIRIWFFVGDLLKWLRAGKSISGVQRVTLELLDSALCSVGSTTTEVVPCIRSPKLGLTSVPVDVVRAETGGAHQSADRIEERGIEAGDPLPWTRRLWGALFQRREVAKERDGGDDHVLFTGVVWTPAFQQLFEQLHASDVNFSVLVYDIIPIERPDLVSAEHRENFTAWLKTVLSTATVIFVSSHAMIDKLRKCALIFDVRIRAELVRISFGTETGLTPKLRERRGPERGSGPGAGNGFVLSVGTIDKRKNQLMLVEIWGRLLSDRIQHLPTLILLGRLDIDLDGLTTDGKRAIDSGVVKILSDQPDDVVADLYRDCLFSVFPSFIEGYGLPVAESLRFGKLCICSDLPEIREFAGDLAWYFDPTDPGSAEQAIRSVLDEPGKRREAEAEIARRFVPQPWSSTFSQMISGIASATARRVKDSASLAGPLGRARGARPGGARTPG